MMSQFKQRIHRSRSRRTEGAGAWLRWMCAICVMALCLGSLIGCSRQELSQELTALKTQLYNAVREIEALKGTNQAAEAEIEALKESNASAEAEIEALESSSQAAQEKIEALTGSIEALKGSNQTAASEIGALKSSIRSAEAEIGTWKSRLLAAEAEIKALKGDNAVAESEIEALKGSIRAAEREIEALKEQIKQLQNNTTPEEPTEKIRIYIDQGHNPTSYHNSGATGNGLYEQELTFTIGCLLAERLETDGRFEVCLSRPTAETVLGTDNTSSLETRVQGAQAFGADYFISLHTNAFDSESAQGIEVLVADQGGESYAFGSSLLDGLIQSTNLRDRGMKLNPDLYVLKNATMPAALLEMGFITNSEDAALLSENPTLFAEGIYGGILAYFDLPSADPSTN